MREAIEAAPNPFSMFTTDTPEAQLLFGRNGDPLYGQASAQNLRRTRSF